MPQFDTATFIPQLFWMGILFSILYLGVSTLILPKLRRIMKMRFDKIEMVVKQADDLRVAAEKIEDRVQEHINQAQQNAENSLEEAIKRVKQEVHDQEKILFAKIQARLRAAEKEIDDQQADMLHDVEKIVVRLAEESCQKIMGLDQIKGAAIAEIAKETMDRKEASA